MLFFLTLYSLRFQKTILSSTTISTLIINLHIRMISEGSCYTTEVMMLKIQRCITEINYILKYIKTDFKTDFIVQEYVCVCVRTLIPSSHHSGSAHIQNHRSVHSSRTLSPDLWPAVQASLFDCLVGCMEKILLPSG